MKILLTGVSGCLGVKLASELLRRGHKVVGLDLAPPVLGADWAFEFAQGSFGATDIASDVEAIARLACSTIPETSAANPGVDVAENVIPSVELFERAVATGVRRVVFTSSGGTVYGDLPASRTAWSEADRERPTTAHGAMKLTIETYPHALTHGADTQPVVARISNAYGRTGRARRGHGAVDAFVRAVLRDEEIVVWGDGSVTRDFVHTDDVVAALVALLEAERPAPVHNVSTGRGTPLIELIRLIEKACGRAARVRFEPSRGFDLSRNVLDRALIRDELGWSAAIGLAEGVERVVRSQRS